VTVDVDVVLKGPLAGRAPGGRVRAQVDDGATAADLATALGLPRGPYVYVVNGTAARGDAALAHGDRVQVHPPVAGGAALGHDDRVQVQPRRPP
jgi:sulfur carrier protein ThiS